MKAMIFAAGLGTRLKPLTNDKPKALVEVNGIPILERIIVRFIEFGVTDIIVNVHHFADRIIDFLNSKNNFGINISISDETEMLLETGGGLKKASWFFDDDKPFFVHNADILTNVDFLKMLDFHNSRKSLATLAVRDRKTSRYFLFDKNHTLCGWKNISTNDIINSRKEKPEFSFAFSGVQLISPEIFNYLTQEGAFSITKSYIDLSSKNIISGFQHDNDYWFDLGTLEKLEVANNYLKQIE